MEQIKEARAHLAGMTPLRQAGASPGLGCGRMPT
jgi:hypothetical protein